MRWFGLGIKSKDYFDAPLQLESASSLSAGDGLVFITVLRDFFKSLPLFLIFAFVFLYLQMLTPLFYPSWLGEYNGSTPAGILFVTLVSLILYFGAPALYAQVFMQATPRAFGVRMPVDKGRALIWLIAALCLLEPYIYFCSHLPSFQQYYTTTQIPLPQLLLLNFTVFPVQYFAEEFFFRGYLFIGLWRRVRWHSFWMTDVLFTFAHLGKPGLEILLCIPASVIFNGLTLVTRSIYPAIILHTCIGITMCLLVNWH